MPLVVVLPQFGGQLRHVLLDPLAVVLVGEMRTETAAAFTYRIAVRALAAVTEDARISGAEPRQVTPVSLTVVLGVGELDPFPGKVKTYFWHAANEGLIKNGSSVHAGIRTTLSGPSDYENDAGAPSLFAFTTASG